VKGKRHIHGKDVWSNGLFLFIITNITNHPTPWSKALVEKLIVTQLLKKLPGFYGT
jgi:hypothetical protein